MFTIGLTLEKETLRIAVLKKEKKSIIIDSLQTLPHESDNVKLFYNLPPFHTGKDVQIVSGLSGPEVFIRKLHLPLREKRKILAALPFQMETLVPFSNDTSIICPLLKPLSKKMSAVTVIATDQSYLSSHREALKAIDIKPDIISCNPIALMRFAHWQFPQEHRILFFDVSEQEITWGLSEKKELIFSQTISIVEKAKVFFELEKLCMFLKQKAAIDDQTPWLLTGDSHDLKEPLSQIFSGPSLKLQNDEFSLYTLPIGLALDATSSDDTSIQFCQKKFTPTHILQSRMKKVFQYLILCAVTTLFMAVGSSLILKKKQRLLIENLQNHFSSTFSKELLSNPQLIEEKLYEWENSLQSKKNSFAFLPTVPKVSDVLAWLSSHPAFANEEGGQKDGIEIKSVHYSLTKYPKIGEVSLPYTASVELEFTSSSPRNARDFHEALLKGDQIVNAKKEVKWQVQGQTYHTSFELNKGVGS